MRSATTFCHSTTRAQVLSAGICSVIVFFMASHDVGCLDHELGSGASQINADSQITAHCLGNMVAKMATQLQANSRATLEIQGDTAHRHNAAPRHDLEGRRRTRKEGAEGKRDSSGQRDGASNTSVTDPAELQKRRHSGISAGSSVGLGASFQEPRAIAHYDNKHNHFSILNKILEPEEP